MVCYVSPIAVNQFFSRPFRLIKLPHFTVNSFLVVSALFGINFTSSPCFVAQFGFRTPPFPHAFHCLCKTIKNYNFRGSHIYMVATRRSFCLAFVTVPTTDSFKNQMQRRAQIEKHYCSASLFQVYRNCVMHCSVFSYCSSYPAACKYLFLSLAATSFSFVSLSKLVSICPKRFDLYLFNCLFSYISRFLSP